METCDGNNCDASLNIATQQQNKSFQNECSNTTKMNVLEDSWHVLPFGHVPRHLQQIFGRESKINLHAGHRRTDRGLGRIEQKMRHGRSSLTPGNCYTEILQIIAVE
jgi:hypothetical protein